MSLPALLYSVAHFGNQAIAYGNQCTCFYFGYAFGKLWSSEGKTNSSTFVTKIITIWGFSFAFNLISPNTNTQNTLAKATVLSALMLSWESKNPLFHWEEGNVLFSPLVNMSQSISGVALLILNHPFIAGMCLSIPWMPDPNKPAPSRTPSETHSPSKNDDTL